MIFTKEIEKISFQDVLDFCEQQHRETIHLDYKQELNGSLAKTIAAMSNTWGGVIVIGVEDEDSKPKLPVKGLSYTEHLREQVNNIILGNIMPPVFPEIQICQSEDGARALIVIRVPQSNATPHATRNNTKVYIRTDTSNEPEELADIGRILWLLEKRKKSTELKEDFYERANSRFFALCDRKKVKIERGDATWGICPAYPFEVLTDYKNLKKDIPSKIRVWEFGNHFPSQFNVRDRLEPTQYGTYGFFAREDSDFIFYEELNHFGFLYHRETLREREQDIDGNIIDIVLMWDIFTKTYSLLSSAIKLYTEIGYWGLLELKLSLDNLRGVVFRDIPLPKPHSRYDTETPSPVDDRLMFTRTFSFQDLKENRRKIFVDLIEEIRWAIGFYDMDKEMIYKLLNEYNV